MAELPRLLRMRLLSLIVGVVISGCAISPRAYPVDNANVATPEQAPESRETESFKTVIQVLNTNDRAVRVKLIDSSCTCTKLDLSDHFLLPNGRTTLNVEIPNKNRSGPQAVHVSLFLSDPEFQPIEIDVWWKVRACIQVDAVAPRADPLERPADKAWQDIYSYVSAERPDELGRLRKRIRLSCPEGEVPAGGLKVLGFDYSGTIWKFTPISQANGSVLIVANARDENAAIEGKFDEKVVVQTNHPDKSAIELRFATILSKDSGREAMDPMDPLASP